MLADSDYLLNNIKKYSLTLKPFSEDPSTNDQYLFLTHNLITAKPTFWQQINPFKIVSNSHERQYYDIFNFDDNQQINLFPREPNYDYVAFDFMIRSEPVIIELNFQTTKTLLT